MKSVKIKYNPFLLSTEILVDGKAPKNNSSLKFGKLRLQEWASDIAKILVDEYQDKNLNIEFTGTLTDFEDLKAGLASSANLINLNSLTHNPMPEVADVEAEVDNIFQKILQGPVAQLRDKSIVEAFKKAKSQEFIINVVATMSSGKSCLINAILDKKLMPVAAMAETATIVSIIDTDQDNFEATAFDADGNKINYINDIDYKTMKIWNKDEKISTIDIYGRIPCVDSVGMRLVLVDTPGPNNSRDKNHQKLTYEMLSDSDKSLVLFVLNGAQLSVNDECDFMDYVCECMSKGGKQSRERYIFVVNKLDSYNPEDDSPEIALSQVRAILEERGITHPNIFPVSALGALEARTNPALKVVLPTYREMVKLYPDMRFDTYYSYNNLPKLSRDRIDGYLKDADEDTQLEIHTGIVSVEEAIRLYINKYARALKVYDLVQSFNNRLNEVAAVAQIKDSIRDNEDKKKFLQSKIELIRKKLDSGQSAKVISHMIERKDLIQEVAEDINDFVKDLRKRINDIIASHSESTQVIRSKALSDVKAITKESNELLAQLDERIDNVLSRSYARLYDDIMVEYNKYIEDLGVSLDDKELGIKPINLVVEEISNIEETIKQSTKVVDEGQYERKTRSESYQEKKTNWIFCPWQWGTNRYETKYRTVFEDVWVPKNVEYINMAEVVSTLYQPVQEQLISAQKEAITHAQNESKRLKEILLMTLNTINTTINVKLEELQKSIVEVDKTEAQIKKQKQDLAWMEGIIERVNKLINY